MVIFITSVHEIKMGHILKKYHKYRIYLIDTYIASSFLFVRSNRFDLTLRLRPRNPFISGKS